MWVHGREMVLYQGFPKGRGRMGANKFPGMDSGRSMRYLEGSVVQGIARMPGGQAEGVLPQTAVEGKQGLSHTRGRVTEIRDWRQKASNPRVLPSCQMVEGSLLIKVWELKKEFDQGRMLSGNCQDPQ